LQGVAQSPEAEAAALCDVDARFLAAAAKKHPRAARYRDFRKMLEKEKLDALVVATPDHTHAAATAAGLRLGLPVYCEKPLTRTVSECRIVRRLAAEKGAPTQLGTQIHAGENYRRVVEWIRAGVIGEVREVHVWSSASYGKIKLPKDRPPVPGWLDWDLWLGPAPYRPYHPEYAPAAWRNWWAFGSGALGDFGCHFMDLPHWALGLGLPAEVDPVDGPPVDPEATPPWLVVRYTYPGRAYGGPRNKPLPLTWYHGGRKPDLLQGEYRQYFRSGVLFVGATGSLLADYTRRVLLPEKRFKDFTPPPKSIPPSVGHHREWVKAILEKGATTCDFSYSGVLSEAVLLGNAAYRAQCKLRWDGRRGVAPNCPEAARYIQHHYRAGWSL
ncbi:MAG: Gfo/Idh/MocA family oxidoreductase, partial [Verrucomicrobia bacterium]|nr:Gfo/Idh/MocA family oxidoreductase [Verrucomicrobiota bacterium]